MHAIVRLESCCSTARLDLYEHPDFTNVLADANAFKYEDADKDANSDTVAHTDAIEDAIADGIKDKYGVANAIANADADAVEDADAIAYADAFADTHADADAQFHFLLFKFSTATSHRCDAGAVAYHLLCDWPRFQFF